MSNAENGEIKLSNVRLAFSDSLFEKKSMIGADGKPSDPRHSVVLIIEPGSANDKALSALLSAVAIEKWKDKAAGIVKKLTEENRVCYLKRDKTDKSGEVYDGFEGKYSVTASSKGHVSVFGRNPKNPDGTPRYLMEADGVVYPGCFVNAVVQVWAQQNSWGLRLNATLKGVQFVADGDAFTATKAASPDAFDDLGVDPAADALSGSGSLI